MSDKPRIDFLRDKLKESIDVKTDFVNQHGNALLLAAEWMSECIRTGRKIMVCGNGGSASDSLHFAGEMLGRFMKERQALPCVALCADVATLTAVGNDYGFDSTFSRQVEGLGQPGDILLVISTSGNSMNIFSAISSAKMRNIRTIGLLGRDGGSAKHMVDLALIASSGKDSARIQETHIFALHCLAELVEAEVVGTSY